MKIAAQLYTVRAYTQTENDIEQTFARIKDLGYECVQISGFGKCSTEFLQSALTNHGLTACATHSPYDEIINDTDALIAHHKALGIRYIGLGYKMMTSKDEVLLFLDEITPALKKIKQAGLQFVYHNHHHEFVDLGGCTPMDLLLENTSADEFGLLIDTHWLQTAGLSSVSFMKKHADRIKVIHLKDFKLSADKERRYAVVGEGNMDFEEILATAKSIGVEYAAVEQDDCYGEDPFDCLKRSLDNIKKMGY